MKRHRLVAIPMLSLVFAILACLSPQDCGGSDFPIKGQVIDKAGEPISGATIRAHGYECYEAEAFDFTVVSDENGHFETEEIFRFACCEFNVEVSAEGYTTQSFVFYPRGEQWPDELPKELVVTLQAE
jgi:hypothetical protein